MSHPMMVKRIAYSFICLWLVASSGFALPEDQKKRVDVQADSAHLNQNTHRGFYLNNVQLDQGTTHIRADKAMTKSNEKNELVEAMIKGNQTSQAHYWTLTALDKPPLHAYADQMRYYPARHLIELIGHARVEQDKESFAASKISFDTVQQHVITEHDEQHQSTIIIHPGNHP